MAKYDITAKGTKVTIETSPRSYPVQSNKPIDSFKIDSTHVIVFWARYVSNNGYLCSQVFSIDSSTKQLTAIGSVNTIGYTDASDISCYQVNSTHYLIFYRGSDSDGYNAIIAVDGSYNTSTATTTEWAANTTIQDNTIQQVDSTHFAVWATDGGITGLLGRVFAVNTSTWAVTSVTTGNKSLPYRTGNLASCKVDSNHFVIFFSNWNGGVNRENYGFVVEINLSTYAMTNGSNFQISSSGQNGLYNYCAKVDSTHVILFWYGLDIDSNAAGARVFTVDTSAHTLTASGTTLSTRQIMNGCVKVDANHVLNFYNKSALVYAVNLSDWSISTVGTQVSVDTTKSYGNRPIEIDTGYYLNLWLGTSDYLYGQIFQVILTLPGPANMKSYNTNLIANIKSIDGNPIANVKSLDTNI